MLKSLFISVFIFSAIQLQGQHDSCNSSLSGKIIDEHDNTPLGFATIYIAETKISAVSDEEGNYHIANICDGTFTVEISHLGCEPLSEKITISGNIQKNFYPEHHAKELKGIEIISEKTVEKNTQPHDSLSQKKMEESKGKTLGDALKNIPGVTTLQTGASVAKPVIHGMHSNRILILNNGVRQEGQQWGSEHAPEIDPFIAGNLSVVKGAASIRYGSDAMAGVIIVEPKHLRDSAGIGGELNLIGFSNGRQGIGSGTLEGNFRKKLSPLSWRIQGTYKQGGNIQSPDYFLKNTGLKEYNFSYSLQWKKQNYGATVFYSQFNTTLGIFSGSHIGNLTDLYKAFNSSKPLDSSDFSYEIGRPFQHIEHELFKANFYVNTGKSGKLNFTYARQYNLRYEYDKHRPRNDSAAALNKPELQLEITTHTQDMAWEHSRIQSFTGTIGISGMMQGNTYEGRFFIPNFRNYNGGIFFIEKIKKPKYELELGARHDYKYLQIYKYQKSGNEYVLISPVRIFQNPSGSFGAIFKPDSSLNISCHFGTAWRTPQVNELYSSGLHHGTASIENGDSALTPEIAFNNILSLQFHSAKKFSSEISVYYNHIKDFIYLKPTLPATLTIQGAFPTFYYRQTDATFKGIDASFFYKPTAAIEFSGKASLVRAWNPTEKQWLVLIPSDRYEAEATYYFKNSTKISDAYFSLNGQFVNKQWRLPENSDFVLPPDEYFLFNIESGVSFPVKNQSIIIGFGIRNILNTAYRDYMDRFRYYTDAMGRNFSVRVKIPFNVSFKSLSDSNAIQINY